MGRAVTFFGAADVPHCSGMTRFGASTDVKVGGIGVSRAGDLNTTHVLPCGVGCCGHVAPIATGSTTVFANGKGIGRVGDLLTGCTLVAEGSENVFAGG